MGQASYRCWQLPEGGRRRKERQTSPFKPESEKGGDGSSRSIWQWKEELCFWESKGAEAKWQRYPVSIISSKELHAESTSSTGKCPHWRVGGGFWNGKRHYFIKGVILLLPFPSSLQVNQIWGYSVFLDGRLIDLIELIPEGKNKDV